MIVLKKQIGRDIKRLVFSSTENAGEAKPSPPTPPVLTNQQGAVSMHYLKNAARLGWTENALENNWPTSCSSYMRCVCNIPNTRPTLGP